MRNLPIFSILSIAALLISACETSRPFYVKHERNWTAHQLPDAKALAHTVFLIGDAGEPDLDPLEANFQLLKKHLDAAGKNSTTIFLGDNIYPAGLLPEDHPDRAESESYLDAQLDMLADYPGEVYFIPGNHDWNKMSPGGLAAVKRQERYIEKYLGDKKTFYPKDGCGSPKAIEVTDDLTIILFDSQWWLHPWNKEPEMHKGCKVESWEEFETKLAELVDEYDDGNILLCMHHPVHTQGSHGGYFPVKEHIFPLTYLSDELFIPLPVLGSLHPTARYLGISKQDPSHPAYDALIKAVNEATHRKTDLVIASGHEHSLQYFYEDEKHYIVSGSGSKPSYVKRGQDLAFGYEKEGFAKLYYYTDGSVWMEFYAASPKGGRDNLLFRKQLKESRLKAPEDPDLEFEDVRGDLPDSIAYVAAPHYAAGKGKQMWLGRNYRDAWATPVKLPVMNMDQVIGGLYPLKKGGGRQSKTMRLEGSDGKEYVLRGIYKDATLTLPSFAQETLVDSIFQDQMSMDHPYGAKIIPPLAEAAGVYHTNPMFYYVPRQPRLGEFNDEYGDKAFLFEERPAKDRSDVASFGNSEDIVSFREMLRETREEYDHLVDQDQALRSRLFDILIGDWDRHDDQWRWATFKDGEKTLYAPVPRDRDHAFLSFRGFLPWLASRKWAARQLQSFNHDFHDIRGLCFNARFFDRHYLNGQDREAWIAAARKMKESVTDEVIERAVRLWPGPIFQLNGPEIIEKLKARRAILPEVAAEYYDFLAREVDIPGTNEQDRFRVTRMDGGKTRVQVFALDDGKEAGGAWYDRTFDKSETKEVRLYGLKKDDEFLITGSSGPNVLVRVIGGSGEDLVRDDSSVSGGKRTKVYDSEKEENILELGKEGKDLTNDDPYDNRYDRKEFKYPKTLPLVYPGINPDDGFILNVGLTRQLYGFRKDPYRAQHKLLAGYAFATGAVSASYEGDFMQVIGKWDVGVEAAYRAPSYTDNFYGLGNNTDNPNTDREAFDFNRMRYGQILLGTSLKRRFALNTMSFETKLQFIQTDVERTDGRISAPENDVISGLSDADFETKQYAGLQAAFRIDKVDQAMFPTRGLRFNLLGGWNLNLKDTDRDYLNFSTDLSVYYQPFSPFPLTFAVRGGYASNSGDYEFFQANYLGRNLNLRGFRGNRFGGDQAMYGNFEARLKLFNIRSLVLPSKFGITGFYDIGRVWYDGDPDGDAFNDWHKGWGFGMFLFSYDLMTISASIAQSEENSFFELGVGFFF